MRLLERDSHGGLTLTKDLHDNIPAYAILSHTWGEDEEEVTSRDIVDGCARDKKGYKKIQFCGEQAARDGLRYFWVDTCCIDKTNNVELTEAINSMFRWYQKAARCYVYLSDVSANDSNKPESQPWEYAFRKSRWFERGWTLQELVAPQSVEFFSENGKHLGCKDSLGLQIHEITGIPLCALQGSLSEFSIEERMSWAEKRITKREEDMAYCLLGILDISMPANYGEGGVKAKARLKRELAVQSQILVGVVDGGHYRTPFSLQGVPKVNKFVDRPSEMRELEQALLPQNANGRQKVFVLYGLGGIGKTQLAVEFVRRHHREFTSVFWLDGRTADSLKQSIANCASRISEGQIAEKSRSYAITGEGDINAVVKDVMGWLSRPDNTYWLMIFDNVDRDYRERNDCDAYDVRHYFSGADHGSVLITTRLAHLEQLGESRRLGTVTQYQADAMFQNRYGGRYDPMQSEELFRILDGLPLAITQAASYMRQSGIGVAQYVKLYKKQWRDLMESRDFSSTPLHDYPDRNVWTTWMISYKAIRSKNNAVANLLLLWACLDNKDLWYGLFADAIMQSEDVADRLNEALLQEIANDEIKFLAAIQLLRTYSLVEDAQDMASYTTHPVVHKWAFEIQDKEQRRAFIKLAMIVVGGAVPHNSTKDYSSKQRRLLPHAQMCWQWMLRGYGEESVSSLRASYSLGMLFTDQGKLDEAEKMYMHALAGYEKVLSAEDISILETVNNLGILYAKQGKLDKEEKMFQRALEGKEKVLGPEHTSTLDTVNNLGNLYADQGKLDEAKKMYMRALKGREKAFGAHHKSTFEIFYNLGVLYMDQGKLDEAEEMYIRALAGYEKVLSGEDISILDTVQSLGNLYKSQENLDEAEKMYLRALKGREKALGTEHISTLDTVNDLGLLYADQGKLDEAEKMYLRALEGKEKALGVVHTSTLDTVNNLGVLYVQKGKLDDAEKTYLRALEGKEKVLSSEHKSTLRTVNNLGILYKSQRRLNDAEKMYLRALEGFEKTLGAEDTLTLITVSNLGALYADQGRMYEAEQMYLRALEGREKVLSIEHKSTLDTVNNLGNLYTDQGKLFEAEQMYMRALEGREKVLGTEHISTLDTVNDLGLLYVDQGKLDEAEKMYLRALEGLEKLLGAENISTLTTVNNIGFLYRQKGMLGEAEKMYLRALKGREKALGTEHISTLDTVNDLGLLYADQGKFDEAEQMYLRALEGKEKAIGTKHTSALDTAQSLGKLYFDRCYSLHTTTLYWLTSRPLDNKAHQLQMAIRNLSILCHKFMVSDTSLFHYLGKILLWAGNEDNASVAFNYDVLISKTDCSDIICNDCQKQLHISIRRYICKSCRNVDLCEICYQKYQVDGILVNELQETCHDHPFYVVSQAEWLGFTPGEIGLKGKYIKSWLQELRSHTSASCSQYRRPAMESGSSFK